MTKKVDATKPEQVRCHLMVAGRVQGVGYRFFAREKASKLDLTGWVRNMHTGNVEIEVQGEKELLSVFTGLLREGPPLSHVTEISTQDIPPADDERGFHIRF